MKERGGEGMRKRLWKNNYKVELKHFSYMYNHIMINSTGRWVPGERKEGQI